jgi:hypothetical protein
MPKASIDLAVWQLNSPHPAFAEKRRQGGIASTARSSFSRLGSGKKVGRQGVRSPE